MDLKEQLQRLKKKSSGCEVEKVMEVRVEKEFCHFLGSSSGPGTMLA